MYVGWATDRDEHKHTVEEWRRERTSSPLATTTSTNRDGTTVTTGDTYTQAVIGKGLKQWEEKGCVAGKRSVVDVMATVDGV